MRAAYLCVSIVGLVSVVAKPGHCGKPLAVNQFAVLRTTAEFLSVDNTTKTLSSGAPVWILGKDAWRFFVTVDHTHFVTPGAPDDDVSLGWVSAEHVISKEDAIDLFSEEISRSPGDARGWSSRGNTYSVIRRPLEAVSDYDRAIQLRVDDPMTRLSRAAVLRRLGRYDEAIADCTRAIKITPASASCYLGRARVFVDAGRVDEAIADSSTAIKLNPNSIGAFFCRGFMNLSEGSVDQAMADAECAAEMALAGVALRGRGRLLCEPPSEFFSTGPIGMLGIRGNVDPIPATALCELLPGYRERLVLAGVASERASLMNDAIVKLDAATLIRLPARAELRVLYHRALARLWKSRVDGASEDVAQAIRLAMNTPDAESLTLSLQMLTSAQATCRGLKAQSAGNFDRALSEYDDAIRINPTTDIALFFRGAVWLAKHENGKAMFDFEQILTDPKSGKTSVAAAFVGRSQILYEQGKFETAIDDLTKSLSLTPGNLNALILRAQSRAAIGRFGQSIEDCDELIRRLPRNALAYRTRAFSWCNLKQYERAMKDYDAAVGLEPRNAGLLADRGATWLQMGDASKALADCELAIRIEPQCSLGYERIAWIHATSLSREFLDGKLAVASATKACELTDWKNDSFIVTLAAAYAESGRFEDAKQRLQEAIVMAPKKDVATRQRMDELFDAERPFREERRLPTE